MCDVMQDLDEASVRRVLEATVVPPFVPKASANIVTDESVKKAEKKARSSHFMSQLHLMMCIDRCHGLSPARCGSGAVLASACMYFRFVFDDSLAQFHRRAGAARGQAGEGRAGT